jgi:2-polyprenyl-3-methyl-5-hydroxy-6-metoxy-1,4-benzoquinol methylase
MKETHYENWQAPMDLDLALNTAYPDDYRRFQMFFNLISGMSYLDVGTGLGGIMDLFRGVASEVHGVELQNEIRKVLIKKNFTVYSNIKSIPVGTTYDVVSLFHVFEHLIEPMETLAEIKNVMKPGATIIIEVPHAKDFLLNTMDLDTFKNFTFWSEHLILHTKGSLQRILKEAGFTNIKVEGIQRYPLANHLYWLRHGKPGGHKEWSNLVDDELHVSYQKFLQNIDQTDTIIATAKR